PDNDGIMRRSLPFRNAKGANARNFNGHCLQSRDLWLDHHFACPSLASISLYKTSCFPRNPANSVAGSGCKAATLLFRYSLNAGVSATFDITPSQYVTASFRTSLGRATPRHIWNGATSMPCSFKVGTSGIASK